MQVSFSILQRRETLQRTVTFYMILHKLSEGKLNVLIENRRRFAERYVYLFDGMILICKTNRKTGSALVGGGGGGCDLKLVSKHLIRRVDVLDRKDTEEVKHTFELIPRDQVKWHLEIGV